MSGGHSYEDFRIGVYVRESRDDNGEEYETIETQRDLLVDFIRKEKLGELVSVYMDDNVSGSVFDRAGIKKLEEDVLSGSINLLLLKDLSRLGRNNARTLLFLDFLEEYGVRVMTSDRRYDSWKDNDIVGIETWYNERYVRDISRKIRANLRFKIEKGDYIGHAPYGYRKSQDEKNRLVVDEEQAEVVKRIYRLYLDGLGYSAIARLLESEGTAPPDSSWNAATVRRILTGRVYLGDTIQGVSERISFKSKKARRLPEEKWVLTEKTHQAIVDREVFSEVQRLRSSKAGSAGSHRRTVHLFTGILYCGACGSRMHARVRRGVTGYICGGYAREGLKACTSHYIKEKDLTLALEDELTRLMEDGEAVKKAERLILEELLRNAGEPDRGERLSAQLLLKERQQEMLYRDRLEGRISLQLFEKLNRSMEGRLAALREELRNHSERGFTSPDAGRLLREAVAYAGSGGFSWDTVRSMVDRITVTEGEKGGKRLLAIDFRTPEE